MSPAMLRGVMGSCLALGVVDLAWLDINAERMESAVSGESSARLAGSPAAVHIERLPPLMPRTPTSPAVEEEPLRADPPGVRAGERPSTVDREAVVARGANGG